MFLDWLGPQCLMSLVDQKGDEDLVYQFDLRMTDLRRLCVEWQRNVRKVEVGRPMPESWGPSPQELLNTAVSNVVGSWAEGLDDVGLSNVLQGLESAEEDGDFEDEDEGADADELVIREAVDGDVAAVMDEIESIWLGGSDTDGFDGDAGGADEEQARSESVEKVLPTSPSKRGRTSLGESGGPSKRRGVGSSVSPSPAPGGHLARKGFPSTPTRRPSHATPFAFGASILPPPKLSTDAHRRANNRVKEFMASLRSPRGMQADDSDDEVDELLTPGRTMYSR